MTIQNTIKCVIFDCDGVLIDSELISARILIEELANIGVHYDHEYVHRNFLGRSWVKVAAEVRYAHQIDLDDAFESNYRIKLLKAFETELSAMHGVKSVIEDLKISCCVATSSSPRRAARSLTIAGLQAYFGDKVFTASEVANGKPAPDLFQHAAAKMGVKPENCLVIEDSLPGVQAALAAEMTVLRFMGGSHLLGRMQESKTEWPDVEHFDKWENFFSIAPDLKK